MFVSKIMKARGRYDNPRPLTCGVTMTLSRSHSSLSCGSGSGSVTSSAAPRSCLALSAVMRAAWSRIGPREMLEMNVWFFASIANSGVDRKWWVSCLLRKC